MSVLRVTITEAEEKYAPAGTEIDISVIGDQVFISVYDGSLEDKKGREKTFEVPAIKIGDLVAALAAHGRWATVHSCKEPS